MVGSIETLLEQLQLHHIAQPIRLQIERFRWCGAIAPFILQRGTGNSAASPLSRSNLSQWSDTGPRSCAGGYSVPDSRSRKQFSSRLAVILLRMYGG
jgi:hypothetical protein